MNGTKDTSHILINVDNLKEQFLDFAPFFLPGSSDLVSSQCRKDVNAIYKAFLLNEPAFIPTRWSLKSKIFSLSF